MPRTLGATAALAVLALLGAGLSAPATAGAADDGLNPGGVTRFPERVRVNVVFVGFDEGDAPWRAVRSELPSSAEPIVRSRAFYGISEPLGLRYSYDFQPHYTSQAWEDGFFRYLSSIAVEKPITDLQQAYNQQSGRLDVTENHWIDAPSVEKRLIDSAPPQVDTRQPTVFFINWYGRSDFKFHVYTKTGEPDPDTGHDFGTNDSRKLVAWGGTTQTTRRRGSAGRAVSTGSGSTTCRQALRRGAAASTSPTPTSTATGADYGSPSPGSTAPTGRRRCSRTTSARSSAGSG